MEIRKASDSTPHPHTQGVQAEFKLKIHDMETSVLYAQPMHMSLGFTKCNELTKYLLSQPSQ